MWLYKMGFLCPLLHVKIILLNLLIDVCRQNLESLSEEVALYAEEEGHFEQCLCFRG